MTKPKPKPKKTTKPAKKPASVVVAPVEPKKPAHRPKGSGLTHEPTQAKKDEIIERLCEGEPWTHIRRGGWIEGGPNDGQPMPSTMTLWRWEEEDEDFAVSIARAREAGQLALLEGTYAIADDSSTDYRYGPKGGLVETDSATRAKIRVWQRLELADRINPAKFAKGKRIMDGDGKPIMPSEIQIIGVSAKKATEAMGGVTRPKRRGK